MKEEQEKVLVVKNANFKSLRSSCPMILKNTMSKSNQDSRKDHVVKITEFNRENENLKVAQKKNISWEALSLQQTLMIRMQHANNEIIN